MTCRLYPTSASFFFDGGREHVCLVDDEELSNKGHNTIGQENPKHTKSHGERKKTRQDFLPAPQHQKKRANKKTYQRGKKRERQVRRAPKARKAVSQRIAMRTAGEKTEKTKRWWTKPALKPLIISNTTLWKHQPRNTTLFLLFSSSSSSSNRPVATMIGPEKFDMNVNNPTFHIENSSSPLYPFDRSTLSPPPRQSPKTNKKLLHEKKTLTWPRNSSRPRRRSKF